MHYVPYALPSLPRQQCPYEEAIACTERNITFMRKRPCSFTPFQNGWCNEHQYVADLLELAARVNYPAFVIAYTNDSKREPCLTVPAGKASWEAYAVVAAFKHYRDVKYRLIDLIERVAA